MLTVEKSWVNVQEKTFTKWSVTSPPPPFPLSLPLHGLTNPARLNNKVKARDIAIENLITDLSDGVSVPTPGRR